MQQQKILFIFFKIKVHICKLIFFIKVLMQLQFYLFFIKVHMQFHFFTTNEVFTTSLFQMLH